MAVVLVVNTKDVARFCDLLSFMCQGELVSRDISLDHASGVRSEHRNRHEALEEMSTLDLIVYFDSAGMAPTNRHVP